MRYVVRHSAAMRSPILLAEKLGLKTRRFPGKLLDRPSYRQDILFAYPDASQVLETDNETRGKVHLLHNFFHMNKFGQRKYLQAQGLPVPWTSSDHNSQPPVGKFVVRPMRHTRSQDYKVTDNPKDFIPGKEYISSLFPKKREYRILCVFGKPLITLRKKPSEGVTEEEAWGHTNSFFQTVKNIPECMLSTTDVYQRLEACPVIRHGHIIGVDVLWNKGGYSVLEFNSSPALTIESNLNTVADYVKGIR